MLKFWWIYIVNITVHSSIYTSWICPPILKSKHVFRYCYQRQYRSKKSYNIYHHPFRTCNKEDNRFSPNNNSRWIQSIRAINIDSWFQSYLEWYYRSSWMCASLPRISYSSTGQESGFYKGNINLISHSL